MYANSKIVSTIIYKKTLEVYRPQLYNKSDITITHGNLFKMLKKIRQGFQGTPTIKPHIANESKCEKLKTLRLLLKLFFIIFILSKFSLEGPFEYLLVNTRRHPYRLNT